MFTVVGVEDSAVTTLSITAVCAWCEETKTFAGEDPEKEWMESGWLIHMNDGEETEYCSLSCAISAL